MSKVSRHPRRTSSFHLMTLAVSSRDRIYFLADEIVCFMATDRETMTRHWLKDHLNIFYSYFHFDNFIYHGRKFLISNLLDAVSLRSEKIYTQHFMHTWIHSRGLWLSLSALANLLRSGMAANKQISKEIE